MDSSKKDIGMYEKVGLSVDWKMYLKCLKELKQSSEEAREVRRKSADWDYIESRPEPLRTALKVLVETGDIIGVSQDYSIPLDELDEERMKAKIPIVLP